MEHSVVKILSLNCQKNYHPALGSFFEEILSAKRYDFLLLQEATESVSEHIRKHGAYNIQTVTDKQGVPCLVSIVYLHEQYTVVNSSHETFFPHASEDIEHNYRSYGVTRVVFETPNNRTVAIGSMHLPAGLQRKERKCAIGIVKNLFGTDLKADMILFGGDCNFGLLGEIQDAERTLFPEYRCLTKRIGPTLNSYYAEEAPHLTNRIASLLRQFGFGLQLKMIMFLLMQTQRKTLRSWPEHCPSEYLTTCLWR